MHLVQLVSLDSFSNLDNVILAQVELKQEILHWRLVETEAAHGILSVEELNKHVSRLILHN